MNSLALDNSWMRRMFDSVCLKYNLLNRIITFGQDENWRQKVSEIIGFSENARILDVCTGTGVLALRLAREHPHAKVYAIDFSRQMLAVARRKRGALGAQNIIFQENDCQAMGFQDGYFDYVTISFGFRNLSHTQKNVVKSLREINRVLKQGGRLIILETSQPGSAFIRRLFHFYAGRILPGIGACICGRKLPYAYLGGSIIKFFDSDTLNSLLICEGFQREKIIAFMFGMVSLGVFQKVSLSKNG